MAQPLAAWVRQSVDPRRSSPSRWLTERYFHRDPLRGTYSDPELIMAPADGTIVHAAVVEAWQSLPAVKGERFTLPRLLDDQRFYRRCLAIGIFLSIYDVHVLRAPISGRVSHRDVEPIRRENVSMLPAELSILDELQVPEIDYLTNERVVSTFRGQLDVIVVQIADRDVDCVVPFTRGTSDYGQGDRFSMIRFGSHAEVLIPLSEGVNVMPTYGPGMHVEAGVDPIARICRVD
jgi:phosphatidylserine decarboxylase